jgi:dTDP-4-dehydrorhamnose 3,5-epimerase
MIEGVKQKKLKVIPDERGRLMELLRSDEELFINFGQVYMTTAYPGVVKGWHYHKKQIDNFIVIKGMVKLVLYDSRDDSPTKGEINEFFMGEHNPLLIQIPPLVLHGFKCISQEEAVCINCPTEAYNYLQPDEYRIPPHSNEIPYKWERKDG